MYTQIVVLFIGSNEGYYQKASALLSAVSSSICISVVHDECVIIENEHEALLW